MSDSSGMEEGGMDGTNGSNGADGADGDAVDLPVAPTAVFGVVFGAGVGDDGGFCGVDVGSTGRSTVVVGAGVDWVAARRARRRARLRARRSIVGRRNSKATISAGGSCGSVPLSW